MPRYTFVTAELATLDRERVVELASTRFPEVALRPVDADIREPNRMMWVCEAPNESHLLRWAKAAAVELIGIRDISHAGRQQRPLIDGPHTSTDNSTHTTTKKEQR